MKNKTPSFIAEFELNTDNAMASILLARFEAARQVYNACLGEALRRWERVKNSQAYKLVKAMPRTKDGKPNKERGKAFGEARKPFTFSEYELHSYAVQFGKAWLGDHLDANTIQKIASRAFRAANEYAIGKRGKPRFKGKNRPLKSVEGKSNAAGIRFKDGQIFWTGLVLPLRIDEKDAVQAYALETTLDEKGEKPLVHRVKYVRLLWREIFGQRRWFAQLVLEGSPYQKPRNVTRPGIVGLDIGPSTVAIVSEDSADLVRFADEIADKASEIARLQRQIDRQRRASNPDNYDPDKWVKNANGNWKHKKVKNKKGKHRFLQTAASRSKSVIGQVCLSNLAVLPSQNGSSVNSVAQGKIEHHVQGALLFPEPHRL